MCRPCRDDAYCFEGAASSRLGCVSPQKTCVYDYTIYADMLTAPQVGHQSSGPPSGRCSGYAQRDSSTEMNAVEFHKHPSQSCIAHILCRRLQAHLGSLSALGVFCAALISLHPIRIAGRLDGDF